MFLVLLLKHKEFITGALVASLLWSLGLIYITYTTTNSRTVGHVMKAEDIERITTRRLRPRIQRTIGHSSKALQEKSSSQTPVVMVTDTVRPRQSKVAQRFNNQQFKLMKPANVSMKFRAVDKFLPTAWYTSTQDTPTPDKVNYRAVSLCYSSVMDLL